MIPKATPYSKLSLIFISSPKLHAFSLYSRLKQKETDKKPTSTPLCHYRPSSFFSSPQVKPQPHKKSLIWG